MSGNAGAENGGTFKYVLSCDVNIPVKFKVDLLEGQLPTPSKSDGATSGTVAPPLSWDWEGVVSPVPELLVKCMLYIDGAPFGLPSRTRPLAMGRQCEWGEWVFLCAKYRDLTSNAQIAFTVWDVASPNRDVPLGGTTCPLFSKRKQLKCGRQKLRLWPRVPGDGATPSSTPGQVPKAERGEVERLERLLNKYESGSLPRLEWLDRLALAAVDRVRAAAAERAGTSKRLHLVVELPTFEHPMIYQEVQGPVGLAPLPSSNQLVRVLDSEIDRVQPSDTKHLKLARSVDRGTIDRDLKPNSDERRRISSILEQPSTRALLGEERELLWRFRFSLTSDKRALTKFLRAVDWSDAQEAKQATELVGRWAPIDIADALELLSSDFTSAEVRDYAVAVLRRADDEELLCYLLQLVQALRYERADESPLAAFLLERAVRNFEIANFLHWYLIVEWQDASHANRYLKVHHELVKALLQVGPEGQALWDGIQRQSELTAQLCAIMREVKTVRGGTQRLIEKLRQLLSSQGLLGELNSFSKPIPLPLDPHVVVKGVSPHDSTVFKSALHPLLLCLHTQGGGAVRIIFKKGDDLRQDQLVIQMVSLMDRLLKKENLDLRLTPYRVLATGQDDGMVEFVPSTALAKVLAEDKTIVRFLQKKHPQEDGPFGIAPEVLDTFVKSCAGYCVIMYILGVGDRHLDNLLLCSDGRLFHIDFGYMLGRDPKPFPPPMKLCREMVEAMGGAESPHYLKFKSYCCEAYNILRKSSNLILNLFHLMEGANIPDIAADPQKGILKLQEKFRLDLDDEAAVQFFQTLINESVSALFPVMVETIHKWAQYWR